MATRIGFDHYTIAHRGLTPLATLEFAYEHNFDGVQFLEPAALDPSLNPESATQLREHARVLGLYLEIGLPSPNPILRSSSVGREVTPAEHAAALIPHVEAAAHYGCSHARVYVGDRHSRFRRDVPWKTQLAATQATLALLTPCLKEHGLRVAIETHADVTVVELLRLLDSLDNAIGGVTFDTGNLVMRLDDPLAAAEKLVPYVLCTHLKDCVLASTPRGLCWQARPIGAGMLPIPELLRILLKHNPNLALSIELHPRTYDLPINDPSWLEFFPDLAHEQLAGIVAFAQACEVRFANGEIPRPEPIEAIPWTERDLPWLIQSRDYLREIAQVIDKKI